MWSTSRPSAARMAGLPQAETWPWPADMVNRGAQGLSFVGEPQQLSMAHESHDATGNPGATGSNACADLK